jgi:HPt (histidine-containing phosphotransfer) domain-containing protein
MGAKKTIQVDPDLKDIIPAYLENRRKDLAAMPALLKEENFEALRIMGHKMRGSGGGYGLDFLTELGAKLEAAGETKNPGAIEAQLKELREFLESLEIVYGDPD